MAGQTQRAGTERDVLTNLLSIALAIALLALGIAYGIDALSRHQTTETPDSASIATLSLNLSGVSLEIPETALRQDKIPKTDFVDRVDLKIDLGFRDATLDDATLQPIHLTLVPKARAKASASLLDSVYLQHFSAEQANRVPGLVGKPLNDSDGYSGETIWFDPIGSAPFTAKCTPPITNETEGVCLRTLELDSGLSAILGFPESALTQWRTFDAPLHAFLAKIGAGTPVL